MLIRATLLNNQSAKSSFDSDGSKIRSGKRRDRIQFSALQNDPRFYISIRTSTSSSWKVISKVVKRLTGFRTYIKLNIENGTVAVNIRSLGKRFHLSKKEILQAYAEKRLEQFIQTTLEEKKLSSVLDNYQRILTPYKKCFFSKYHFYLKTGIHTYDLMKTITQAFLSSEREGFLSSKQIFFIRNQNDKVHVFSKGFFQKTLGKGSYGTVYELIHVGGNKIRVMKEALTGKKTARRGLRNEFKILHLLYQDLKDIEGIMHPPYHLIDQDDFVGYIGKKYSCNLANKEFLIKNSQADFIIKGAKQLLSGLAYMHKRHFVHGDIKLQNCFFDFDMQQMKLGDFGGAQRLQNKIDLKSLAKTPLGIHTSVHVLASDRAKIKQGVKMGLEKEYLEARKAQDVYSLGLVILQLAIGRELYCRTDRQGYNLGQLYIYEDQKIELKEDEIKKRLLLRGYSMEFANLILGMLDNDMKKRLNPPCPRS